MANCRNHIGISYDIPHKGNTIKINLEWNVTKAFLKKSWKLQLQISICLLSNRLKCKIDAVNHRNLVASTSPSWIKNVKMLRSKSPDNMSNALLESFVESIPKFQRVLFSSIANKIAIPELWRTSTIVPISMGGQTGNINILPNNSDIDALWFLKKLDKLSAIPNPETQPERTQFIHRRSTKSKLI